MISLVLHVHPEFGHRVNGTPDGLPAFIKNFGTIDRGDWRVMRTMQDRTRTDWTGSFASADEAMRSLEKEPEYPGLIACALIVRDDRVLLERHAYPGELVFWDLPGGKVEAGETPAEAIVREIKEEIDQVAIVIGMVGDLTVSYGRGRHWVLATYECVINGQPTETESLKWVHPWDMYESGQPPWIGVPVKPADFGIIQNWHKWRNRKETR